MSWISDSFLPPEPRCYILTEMNILLYVEWVAIYDVYLTKSYPFSPTASKRYCLAPMIHLHRSTEPLKKTGKESIAQIARVYLLCHGSDYNTTDQYNLDHLRVTINILPDDALLEIFDLYVNNEDVYITQWQTLVHVCRRWRRIVFAYPRRLNLRLVYKGMKPSRTLETWPDFPLILSVSKGLSGYYGPRFGQIWDNIAAVLNSGCRDRVYSIYLRDIPKSHLETIAAVMQKPFQGLKNISLSVLRASDGDLVIPDSESFLGDSAPRLRTLALEQCSFLGMQKLLLSANNLVTLSLWDIPHSGYISPDAMVAALSVMTRLNTLQLEFRSPLSRPDPEPQLPPQTRTVLSTITRFTFKGVREYSEDLMARIDVPLLWHLSIVFFMDLIFDVPQLCRFISDIEGFKTFHRAEVTIDNENILCTLSSQENTVGYLRHLDFGIHCRRVDWQLSSLAHVCGTLLPPISVVEVLEIGSGPLPLELRWKDDMEPDSTQWLELLVPFTAVKEVTLHYDVAQYICHALKELDGERATEVLPALQNMFSRDYLSEASQTAIKTYVAARQLSGHPVSFYSWKSDRGRWEDIIADHAVGD